MGARLSHSEIQRRIADLLKTPDAGRAVAGHLRQRTADWACRAAIADLRARRADALRSAAAEGDGDGNGWAGVAPPARRVAQAGRIR